MLEICRKFWHSTSTPSSSYLCVVRKVESHIYCLAGINGLTIFALCLLQINLMVGTQIFYQLSSRGLLRIDILLVF
jgi:hypothetical protein